MNKNIQLTLDLIPQSSFYKNVRQIISKKQWDIIRNIVYSKAWHVCEICGNTDPNDRLDCHEVWNYDNKKLIQKLERMIALCPSCHQCKHFGFAQIQGKEKEAFNHLMKINSWSKSETEKYITNAFREWEKRSKKKWKLDVSSLKEYGIDINYDDYK